MFVKLEITYTQNNSKSGKPFLLFYLADHFLMQHFIRKTGTDAKGQDIQVSILALTTHTWYIKIAINKSILSLYPENWQIFYSVSTTHQTSLYSIYPVP
jgi:hypothetical protein